jgi:class 3 adenylate cyclase
VAAHLITGAPMFADMANGIPGPFASLERGYVKEVKALGDGFMIAFGSPRKALACAAAIQQAVEEQLRMTPVGAVRVRIGVNTGDQVRS